jgi:hypothetical protein
MSVIAVTGDDSIAWLGAGLQSNDHSFLSDIEVTEATDESHAVQLAGALFKAANQKHIAVVFYQLFGCRR